MSTAPKRQYSEAEYLELERAAEYKSEFYRGEIFRMQGASKEHVRILSNLHGELYILLKGGPCQLFGSDMRLKVSANGLYTYPDLMVTCEHPEFADNEFDNFLNPQLIFEVLSQSTERYDRTAKMDFYKQLPSLKSYVLVSQDFARIEKYSRTTAGQWIHDSADGLSESITIEEIGCELHLKDIYNRVKIDESKSIRARLVEEKKTEYILPRPGMVAVG